MLCPTFAPISTATHRRHRDGARYRVTVSTQSATPGESAQRASARVDAPASTTVATSRTTTVAADPAAVLGGQPDTATLRRLLTDLPGVDEVGVRARVADLGTRSIKTTAKAWAIDLAISMIDLTTLEGADTVGKVRSLGVKGRQPDPDDATCPQVAALCVYPDMVPPAMELVAGTGIKVASVATAFPSGRAGIAVKLADTAEAVAAGAHEIDMVIDRGAFLAGDYAKVFDEIVQVREQCQRRAEPAHLKVILETGELATLDNVRRASWLAMLAGADFIKTSTGKISPAATLPVTFVMLQAIRDFTARTGRQIGMKPAGGIRTTKDALKYLVMVNEVLGDRWLDPDWFRFGASSLLDDLLMQRRKLATGHYSGPAYLPMA